MFFTVPLCPYAELNKFLSKLDKRYTKDKASKGTFREKQRKEGLPTNTPPPPNAPDWTLSKDFTPNNNKSCSSQANTENDVISTDTSGSPSSSSAANSSPPQLTNHTPQGRSSVSLLPHNILDQVLGQDNEFGELEAANLDCDLSDSDEDSSFEY